MSQMVQPGMQFVHRSGVMSSQLAERDQISSSLADLLKVVVFLLLAMACRYYLTSESHSPIDGESAAATDVESIVPTPSPNLMDLSTVGF